MKKIIVSAAVAAMALSTTASALEDIKVNGQAKIWYETDNNTDARDLFSKDSASGEVAMKLGLTGKQGGVTFEGEMTYATTMGLEGNLVADTGVRSVAANGGVFVSKANVTVPLVADTAMKLGRQELNTPLAFTEKWNSVQNNFDAGLLVNSSIENLTIIGAFVGQTNATSTTQNTLNAAGLSQAWRADTSFNQMHGGAYALAALYNNKTLAVNAWYYNLRDVGNVTGPLGLGTVGNTPGIGSAQAIWLDAGLTTDSFGVKGYFAQIMPSLDGADNSLGYALSANVKAGGWTISGAFSMVDADSPVAIANVATGGKKTQLPTAGIYTDGLYVAQADSTAMKLKAAGKVGSTGLALQVIQNTNDTNAALETTEADLIISDKLGDINLKAIVMHRMMDDTAAVDDGQYVRVIADINF